MTQLRRPCKTCDTMFQPNGRCVKMCDNCRERSNKKAAETRKLNS